MLENKEILSNLKEHLIYHQEVVNKLKALIVKHEQAQVKELEGVLYTYFNNKIITVKDFDSRYEELKKDGWQIQKVLI